jgi:hypothetical protein
MFVSAYSGIVFYYHVTSLDAEVYSYMVPTPGSKPMFYLDFLPDTQIMYERPLPQNGGPFDSFGNSLTTDLELYPAFEQALFQPSYSYTLLPTVLSSYLGVSGNANARFTAPTDIFKNGALFTRGRSGCGGYDSFATNPSITPVSAYWIVNYTSTLSEVDATIVCNADVIAPNVQDTSESGSVPAGWFTRATRLASFTNGSLVLLLLQEYLSVPFSPSVNALIPRPYQLIGLAITDAYQNKTADPLSGSPGSSYSSSSAGGALASTTSVTGSLGNTSHVGGPPSSAFKTRERSLVSILSIFACSLLCFIFL